MKRTLLLACVFLVALGGTVSHPLPLKTIEQTEAEALSKLEQVGGKELFKDLLPACWGHDDRSSFCGPLAWTSNSDSLAAKIGNGELLPNLSPICLTADVVQESIFEEENQCKTSRNPLTKTPLNQRLARIHGTTASNIATWLDGLEGEHLIDYIQRPGDFSKGGRGREVQSRFLSEPLTSYTLRRSFLRDRKEALLFPHQRISMINPVRRKLPSSTSSSSPSTSSDNANLGSVLELLFIRFVSPSEHTISGTPVELELQLHMKYSDFGGQEGDRSSSQDEVVEAVSYEEEISRVDSEAKTFASTSTFLNATDLVMSLFFQVGRRDSSRLDALLRGRKSLSGRSGHSTCEKLLEPWLGDITSTSQGSRRDDVGATISCLKEEITQRYSGHSSTSETLSGDDTGRWMNCFLPTALQCEVSRRLDRGLTPTATPASDGAIAPTGGASMSSTAAAGDSSDGASTPPETLVHALEKMCAPVSNYSLASEPTLESFDEDFETSGPVVLGNLLKEGTTSQTASYFFRLGSLTHGEKASLFASDERGGKTSVGEVEWILLKEPGTIGFEQLRYVREEILGFDALPINNESDRQARLQRHRSRLSYQTPVATSSSASSSIATFNLAYDPSGTSVDNASFSGLNFVLSSNARPLLQLSPIEGNQKRLVRASHFSSSTPLSVAEAGETSTCLLYYNPLIHSSTRNTPTLSSPPTFGGISGGDWTVDTVVALWQSIHSSGMKPLTGRDGFDDLADLGLTLSLLTLIAVAPYLLIRFRKQLGRWQKKLRLALDDEEEEAEPDDDTTESEGGNPAGHPSEKYELQDGSSPVAGGGDSTLLLTNTTATRPYNAAENERSEQEEEGNNTKDEDKQSQLDPEWAESLIEQGSIAASEHGDLEDSTK